MKGLTKKLGPLPVWAWAAIVVGVVGFFWLRSKSNAQPTTPSTNDQPTQATGAMSPDQSGDQGNPAPLGLDPSLLDALASQNSTMLQSLLNAFQGAYGGGNYGTATGNPYATATPTGASTVSGATPTPVLGASFIGGASPFALSGTPLGVSAPSPGFSNPQPLGASAPSPGFSNPAGSSAPAPQVHSPGVQLG